MRALLAILAFVLSAAPAAAQVVFDTSSEAHTGTTGSASEASFSWSHGGAASNVKGVGVCVYQIANSGDDTTSVTYGGAALTRVTGGAAFDTATEPGAAVLYFLGSSVPQGTQTVEVNRANNVNILTAQAFTVTAAADTSVTGVVLLQEDGLFAEQSVDDGSPGQNSVRLACGYSGASTLPVGPNSTSLQTITISASRTAGLARETTAGQGARSVGFDQTSDDRAGVHFAVKETAGVVATPCVIGGGVVRPGCPGEGQ
jgi:hypothetical protein